jgi:hypothetical protein
VTAEQQQPPPSVPVRYKTTREDSARWNELEFRQDDIVVSARSRSGTTWMQMICALLVFQDPKLPAPLSEMSPWLDWQTIPLTEVLSVWPRSGTGASSRPTRRWTACHSTRASPTSWWHVIRWMRLCRYTTTTRTSTCGG